MRAPRDASDVQSVIKFSPYTMQHVHSNGFHCLSYANLQFIDISGHWRDVTQALTVGANEEEPRRPAQCGQSIVAADPHSGIHELPGHNGVVPRPVGKRSCPNPPAVEASATVEPCPGNGWHSPCLPQRRTGRKPFVWKWLFPLHRHPSASNFVCHCLIEFGPGGSFP
jgi:hypothetical protein